MKKMMMMSLAVLMLSSFVGRFASAFDNMNGAYILSTTPHQAVNNWSTHFKDYPGGVEYFEFYVGPITSTYAEVFWTPLPRVNLTDSIIQKFDNKAMAVVGIEADQVRRTKDGDVSVPITVAYNHHYGFNLLGKNSEMRHIKTPPVTADKITMHPGPSPGFSFIPVDKRDQRKQRDKKIDPSKTAPSCEGPWCNKFPSNSAPFPSSLALGYSNGGEFRKTYHGLAPPFAQIIDSPTHVSVVPMQIDTWNRDLMNLTSGSPFHPGPTPKNSYAPKSGHDAIYSGLLECPLTTRIRKKFTGGGWNDSVVAHVSPCNRSDDGTNPIASSEACFSKVQQMYGVLNSDFIITNDTVNDSQLPLGCTVTFESGSSIRSSIRREMHVRFNTIPKSTVECGGGNDEQKTLLLIGKQYTNNKKTNVGISMSADDINITLVGPSDVWYGAGFDASSMSNSPYAIVVDGINGTVTEHVLGNHMAGTQITTSVVVLSNSVSAGGIRTIVLTRSTKGQTPQHHSFTTNETKVNIISAFGSSPHLSYHQSKETSTIALWPPNNVTLCVCTIPAAPFGKGQGTLEYLPTGEVIGFPIRCQNPTETVLANQNPTCDVRTYVGGLSACHHGWHLLDNEQDVPWEKQPLEYWLKFRIYYQEYIPNHHIETFDITWTIAGAVGEYDVPQCAPGTPVEECTHEISGIIIPPGDDLHFVAAHYHCHAPTCLSIEIWTYDDTNNKTMDLICKESPYHGRGNVEDDKFDEEGYIAVPICMWGLHPPFEKPPLVSGVPLFVKAITNNTFGHHGEMALPQMLLAHL